MAWFKKSGDDKKDGAKQRQHDRVQCDGEVLTLITESGSDGLSFELLDVSLGGFAITGYEGPLHGNQYFEFRFNGELGSGEVTIEGFANVVRVKNGMLAAKFTPQPKIKAFFRNYIDLK
ncbi:MAG: PilZ domain-containing protein [Rhodospirillaceae bacterium]|jgi:hypothetical protein|nr:PilZ domain-containing protein [Rhodospirillaceae bacterium]